MWYAGLSNVLGLMDKTSVFLLDEIDSFLLLPGQAEAHRAADVVIFQDAHAHPLPTGNILGTFDVVGIIRDFTCKNDPGFSVQSVVGNAISLDRITVFLQFADGFFLPTGHRRFCARIQ